MYRKILALSLAFTLSIPFITIADEGMWLPLLVKRLNYEDMQNAGLKLTAEEIYDVNNSSLKDAIVRLGRGFCTAEIISSEGLMLTNHHCGYDIIQGHSSVENDYLTNGFWAMNRGEEIANPGLTATFLVRMADVTEDVLSDVTDDMSEEERAKKIRAAIRAVTEENSSEEKGISVEVKSFFHGNEYYLFEYLTYEDVRLVGAPPESIGKYGGDTDNWMWPRHTGDFALFRVYTAPDGSPAEFSKANVPLKPKHFLPVSTAGVKQDDFAIVMGYPGSTDRYLTSEGVKLEMSQVNDTRIKVRGQKLAIMKESMDADDATRIKYAAKYSQSSNYYKYSIGQNKGFTRMRTVEQKAAQEANFNTWANNSSETNEKYGKVLSDMNKAYTEKEKVNLYRQYYIESVFLGAEIFRFASGYRGLEAALENKKENREDIEKQTAALQESVKDHFKEYDVDIDKELFGALLKIFYDNVPRNQHPPIFKEVENKYKGDFDVFAYAVYKRSMFTSEAGVNRFLANPSQKKLLSDPAYKTFKSVSDYYNASIRPILRKTNSELDKNYRLYVQGLREMNTDKVYYPDANSTMRLSYGKVKDYIPADAVFYKHYTTLGGVMEKKDNTSDEFVVPDKLEQLYMDKDFGQYG
ncbi:MAG: S46 family peptidase, partial [Bacteroidia bacterium]|nr:S46 family peptidase [Bacteroidia bacterium]